MVKGAPRGVQVRIHHRGCLVRVFLRKLVIVGSHWWNVNHSRREWLLLLVLLWYLLGLILHLRADWLTVLAEQTLRVVISHPLVNIGSLQTG